MKPITILLNNIYLKYIILFFSLCFSIFFIFYGIDFTDSVFYINSLKEYPPPSFYPLTAIIAKCWIFLFGDKLLYFRILNWLLNILSIVLPFIIIIPSNQKDKFLYIISLSIILMTVLNYNIFGPDICTVFFLSITLSYTIKFYQNNKIIYLILLSFFSSLLMLSRFPNILIVPIFVFIFVILEFNNHKFKSFKNSSFNNFKTLIIFLIVSLSIYLIINIVIYSGFNNYISKLISDYNYLKNDNSHSIFKIIINYITAFIKVFQYIGVCFIFLFIIDNKLNFNKYFQFIIILIFILIFLLFLNFETGIVPYNWKLSHFNSAVIYTLLLSSLIVYYKNREYNKYGLIMIVVVVSILPIIGSNTGLLKLSNFLIAFLPIIYFLNVKIINKSIYLKLFLFIFLSFVFYTKMMYVFEDSPLKFLKYKVENNKLEFLKTSKINKEYIEDVTVQYNTFNQENKSVLFFGKCSHIFYYLFDKKYLYRNSFWMLPDDIEEINKVEKIIQSKQSVVFFMPHYPMNAPNYFKNRTSLSLFEEMLIKNGYSVCKRNGYYIYNRSCR